MTEDSEVIDQALAELRDTNLRLAESLEAYLEPVYVPPTQQSAKPGVARLATLGVFTTKALQEASNMTLEGPLKGTAMVILGAVAGQLVHNLVRDIPEFRRGTHPSQRQENIARFLASEGII